MSDVELQRLARAYATDPTDGHAHALARAYARVDASVAPSPQAIESRGANCVVMSGARAHVLFSYGTPVAACVFGTPGRWVWSPDAAHSVTSRRHITKWFRERGQERKGSEEVTPAYLAELSQ